LEQDRQDWNTMGTIKQDGQDTAPEF